MKKVEVTNRKRKDIITDDLLGMELSNQEQHFITWDQFRHLNSWSPMHPYIVTGRGTERKVKCPMRKNTVLLGIQMNSTETGYTEYRRRKNGDLEIIQRSEIYEEERLHPDKYDPDMTAEEADHWRHDDLYLTVSVAKRGQWNPDMHLTMREAVRAKLEQIGYPDTGLEEYVLLPEVQRQLYLIRDFIEEEIEQYLRDGIRYDIRSGFYSKGVRAYAG